MTDQDTNATLAMGLMGWRRDDKRGEWYDPAGRRSTWEIGRWVPTVNHACFARVEAEAIKRFPGAYPVALAACAMVPGVTMDVMGKERINVNAEGLLNILSLPLAAKCAAVVGLLEQEAGR